jgi:hypothetical protein
MAEPASRAGAASGPADRRSPLSVVIPLRWASSRPDHARDVAEMRSYLQSLSAHGEVVVVDGSDEPARRVHADAWWPFARVIPPEGQGTNGKVVGSLTGLRHASHELVVLADDDVRHDAGTLDALRAVLERADLVRPQNVYDRWTWPARWDFGRCLVNRAFGADWPGTFAMRRTAVLEAGGWSTEVLFENLQLVRTARTHGLRVVDAPGLVVPRTPPSAVHFRSQRVRQAYDDLAQPPRLAAELALLPLLVTLAARRWRLLVLPVSAAVVVGEVGRRRFGGVPAPATSALWCPVWMLERSVTVWLALVAFARGGVRYHGLRVRYAALPVESPAS